MNYSDINVHQMLYAVDEKFYKAILIYKLLFFILCATKETRVDHT